MRLTDYIANNYDYAQTFPEENRKHWMCLFDMLTDNELQELNERLGRKTERKLDLGEIWWNPPVGTVDIMESYLYYAVGSSIYDPYEDKFGCSWMSLANESTYREGFFFSMRMNGYGVVFALQAMERLGYVNEVEKFREWDNRLNDIFADQWKLPPSTQDNYLSYLHHGWLFFCQIGLDNFPEKYRKYCRPS